MKKAPQMTLTTVLMTIRVVFDGACLPGLPGLLPKAR